jgi:hypothetical protein
MGYVALMMSHSHCQIRSCANSVACSKIVSSACAIKGKRYPLVLRDVDRGTGKRPNRKATAQA